MRASTVPPFALAAFFAVLFLGSFPVCGEETVRTGETWIVPIRGDIEPSIAAFVRRESRRALASGASFLVYDIDTFGGRVDTALQISSFIGSVKDAVTVAWVRSGPESMGVSWSAGALIALSCSRIYMANGTSMGAAAPVTIGADGKSEPLGEKTVSAVRSQMAALAEKNGHPASIALAMVDQDVELWEIEIAGVTKLATLGELELLEKEKPGEVKRLSIVSAKGKLLALTAGEALRYGLSRGIADDLPTLLQSLGAEGEVVELIPSFADRAVAFLTSAPVQALLILLGLVALFMEINTPGFGIPGAIALIAFLGVFGANALLGSVGSLELILFLFGIGLLAVEIFVIPGFGLTGVSGLVLIGASLVFSMQDFVVPTFPWQWELLGRNLLVVALGLIAATAGIAFLALAGPRLRMFDRLTLKSAITGTAGGSDTGEGESEYGKLVGSRGVSTTTLRPSGKAEIGGREYVVEADGQFVQPESPIVVERVLGNRIIVRTVAAGDDKIKGGS
ncbi:MAG TPA: hypothetical protein DIC34_14930 [Treponema sp.]|nr:hypothetical protein [Treponema sp.]